MSEIGAVLLAFVAIFAPLGLVWAMIEWHCRKDSCRTQKKGQ